MKGAVWIIGSLFWDDDQGDNKGARKKWRSLRLKMKEAIRVKAPIRYGRRSKNGEYTMVFSKSADKEDNLGTAFVVPLKKEISTFKGIINQAEFLSRAEGTNDVKLIKGNSEKWCIIGILFNPNFSIKKKEIILNSFYSKLKTDGFTTEHETLRVGSENSVMTEFGEIKLNWPMAKNKKYKPKLDTLDFILATCTVPNIQVYPSIQTLREGIANDKRNYFIRNVKCGISTFEDKEILRIMRSKKRINPLPMLH